MDFSGPEPADYANVESLNRAFLRCVRQASCGRYLRQQLPQKTQRLVEGLTDLHVERLSATPFLLLSLRERDESYWRALVNDESNGDLLVAVDSHTDGKAQSIRDSSGFRRDAHLVRATGRLHNAAIATTDDRPS